MFATLRAKEEIVHPASIVDLSTPSVPLRSTLSALLNQLPSQILPYLRGMGGGYFRHQRRTARRHLFTPFRPGSTRTSFRQAEVRSQIPPRAASCDPQAPATGDVRRALSQERNCSSSFNRPSFRIQRSATQYAACYRLSSISLLHKFSLVCAV
jgi:hypothetical protein